MDMNRQEKIEYLKQNLGISYNFIAKKTGILKQNLWRFRQDKTNKVYAEPGKDKLDKLDKYLEQYEQYFN